MKEQFSKLSPQLRKWLKIFFVLCALVTLADIYVYWNGGKYPWSFFGFYSIYGFISCVVLVIIATKMRQFLMRKEEYYDD